MGVEDQFLGVDVSACVTFPSICMREVMAVWETEERVFMGRDREMRMVWLTGVDVDDAAAVSSFI